jgi:hypothetical protein
VEQFQAAMMEFIPIALACGHILRGPAIFEMYPGEPTLIECPEGCGMVEFVIEPGNVALGELGSSQDNIQWTPGDD